MSDSIRQQIVTALDTRFKAILVANGYVTNLGEHIFEWRTTEVQEAELPALIWRDYAVSEAIPVTIMGASSLTEQAIDVELDIMAQDGPTTGATIRSLIADVQKAIGVDHTWGGLAIRTDDAGNETGRDQAGKITGSVTMRIRITYRTKLWNAYE